MSRRRLRTLRLVLCGAALLAIARPSFGESVGRPAIPDPAGARDYLATVEPGKDLQSFLDRTVADVGSRDPGFLRATPRVAALDLGSGHAPRLAHVRGDLPVYPASVIKFIYLMAAYAFQERGQLRIDTALDTELSGMIRQSSNISTQKVFARITGAEPGPALAASEYPEFRRRRLLVKDWLESLGVRDLHAVNPTYNGGGDITARDAQFLRDRTVKGGLPASGDKFSNRNAMTASGTVRLLALLATDRALNAEDSATVRTRMKRDIQEQPHLARRIAGGAAKIPGAVAYAKSGTWGPIYADAGIVRDAKGHEFAIAVFTESSPAYHGNAIAEITERVALYLFDERAALGAFDERAALGVFDERAALGTFDERTALGKPNSPVAQGGTS